jgi:hypothetical protein
MNTWTDEELDAIQDAEHREAAWADGTPADGRQVVPGRTFTKEPVPPPSTALVLSTVGDVLNALERHCVSDVVDAWTRLAKVVPMGVRLPAVYVGFELDPWGRLISTVIQALCYASYPSAPTKWAAADVAICAWVGRHWDSYAAELARERDLSDRDLSEDGPADPVRLQFLEAEIDRFARFLWEAKS